MFSRLWTTASAHMSLLRLSFRIRATVLKARAVPADVAGIIQCVILYLVLAW